MVWSGVVGMGAGVEMERDGMVEGVGCQGKMM